MIVALFLSVVAAAGFVWLQLEMEPPAAVADFPVRERLEATISPQPTPTVTPEVAGIVADGEQASLEAVSSPRVAPAAAQQPTSIVERDEDCDGKEIHVERQDGEDVSIDVTCDKQVEGGGSVSNSVSIDADTGGGEGNSGAVKVDLNISNSVGAGETN